MIRFENISISFDKKPLLADFTLTLPKGEFTCILGRNGSGKSSLLRCAMGLIPCSGNIFIDGIPAKKLSGRERAHRIAYLPQNYPTPNIDVRTLIASGRFPHTGFSHTLSRTDNEILLNAAKETGVAHLLDRDLTTLSGGERQRAYISMVIAQNAEAILLDEPASSLDISYQSEIIDLLSRLHKGGRTIIMVAHDLPQAFSCATHIAILSGGSLAAEGTPEQLWNHPAIRESFGAALTPSKEADAFYRYQLIR